MIKQEKGKWIAFEGNDGSGKSTQLRQAAEYMTQNGLQVVVTREPGGNEFSEQVRELIFNPAIHDDPVTQLLLFTAARRRNIQQVVLPNIRTGKIVLSDRSEGSTFAYQHFQFGLPWEVVYSINNLATGGLKPDLTVLLDVDEEVGMGRVLNARGQEVNHFDKADLKAVQRRREGYLKLARGYGKYKHGLNKWVVVDAGRDANQVFVDIKSLLDKWLKS